MARRLVQYMEMTDDLDKVSKAEDTIELGVDGTVYEIDLTNPNAQELRDFLKRYMDAAHASWKMPPRPGRKKRSVIPTGPPPVNSGITSRQRVKDRDARREIRDWALQEGLPSSRTGIIRADTIRAYQEAHPGAYIPPSSLEAVNA